MGDLIMKLSRLQKYTLLLGYGEKSKFSRVKLLNFYNKDEASLKIKDRVNIITKSLERLIDRGLLIGYGIRTPKKWFIKEIKLTVAGKKIARDLQGKQERLPLK